MNEHAQRLVLPQWLAKPYDLISWCVMEQVAADKLATAIMILETIKCGWCHAEPLGDAMFASGPRVMQPQERDDAAKDMAMAEKLLNEVGLPTSARTINELRVVLVNWKNDYYAQFNSENMVARIEETERTIRREMQSIMFMYIPASRAPRYKAKEPFGANVGLAFPSAVFDLEESGNSYAAARYTACVFHLMRSLEIGLAAFAGEFGIAMNHTNWQPIIEQIESKVRDLAKAPGRTPADKAKHEFYAQVATSFMFLKDAWRNYTMHVRGKYTEDEADTIYRNVGAFIQKLADGGIHE